MRISWNWLKTLADLDGITPQEAADVLTSTGLEVEHVDMVEPVKGMLAGVVVGQVLECAKHPDADRLSVCRVDLGTGETAQIICGAPNVAAGQKVLVATVGSTLHMADGSELTIKKAKIRGVESHGMICAEDELGLGTSHGGILVLDPGSKVRMPAAEHLGLRTRAQLLGWIAAGGLRVLERHDVRPVHAKATASGDALQAARAAEVTSLWRLAAA